MSEKKDLIAIMEALGISDRIADSTNTDLLRSVISHLKELESKSPNEAEHLTLGNLPDSLAFPASSRDRLSQCDSSLFWAELRRLQNFLRSDHSCRRQMLLNRLDCTVESFKWKGSDGSAKQGETKESLNGAIHDRYDKARVGLNDEPNVTLSHLLALRESECDNLLNSVVSTRKIDCKISYKQHQQQKSSRSNKRDDGDRMTNLKQVIIPDVPDRGGRTDEIRPPIKETFGQQRRNFRGRGGRR